MGRTPEREEKLDRAGIDAALSRIPQNRYLMIAAFEHRIRGMLVSWVQQASLNPPMVVVGLPKGREIIPLIHDNHAFALSEVDESDKLILRKFDEEHGADEELFQALITNRKITGSPILHHARAYLDCELVKHIDIEGDHDLYIGSVRAGEVVAP